VFGPAARSRRFPADDEGRMKDSTWRGVGVRSLSAEGLPVERPPFRPAPKSSPELFAMLLAVMEGEGGMIVKLGADPSEGTSSASGPTTICGGGFFGPEIARDLVGEANGDGDGEGEGEGEGEGLTSLLKKLGAMIHRISSV
jgi:hypothetical protein